MNKIEVSREVFEKIFRKGGEMKYKEMTNQFMQELPEHVKDIANAEIEKNEYLQTKGRVKKALGETHENGGIKTVLEEGDRVLSDFLKIGAELSKKLNKEYEIKTKATDTYAKVLDKYLKKIGRSGLLPGGAIITGGGSDIHNIETIAKNNKIMIINL